MLWLFRTMPTTLSSLICAAMVLVTVIASQSKLANSQTVDISHLRGALMSFRPMSYRHNLHYHHHHVGHHHHRHNRNQHRRPTHPRPHHRRRNPSKSMHGRGPNNMAPLNSFPIPNNQKWYSDENNYLHEFYADENRYRQRMQRYPKTPMLMNRPERHREKVKMNHHHQHHPRHQQQHQHQHQHQQQQYQQQYQQQQNNHQMIGVNRPYVVSPVLLGQLQQQQYQQQQQQAHQHAPMFDNEPQKENDGHDSDYPIENNDYRENNDNYRDNQNDYRENGDYQEENEQPIVIKAAVISHHEQKELYHVVDNHQYHPPTVVNLEGKMYPVVLNFDSFSSPLITKHVHHPGMQHFADSYSFDEPHTHVHTVNKPVIHQVREVISPYKNVYRVIQPMKENVQTFIHQNDVGYPAPSLPHPTNNHHPMSSIQHPNYHRLL